MVIFTNTTGRRGTTDYTVNVPGLGNILTGSAQTATLAAKEAQDKIAALKAALSTGKVVGL